MTGGASNFYINVAINPASLTSARAAILSLARDVQKVQTINLFGGSDQRAVLSAAQGLTNLYREQAVLQSKVTSGIKSNAAAEATAVEQAENRKRQARKESDRQAERSVRGRVSVEKTDSGYGVYDKDRNGPGDGEQLTHFRRKKEADDYAKSYRADLVKEAKANSRIAADAAEAVEQAEARKQQAKRQTVRETKVADEAAKPKVRPASENTMNADEWRRLESERRRRERDAARATNSAQSTVDADPRGETRQNPAAVRREFEKRQAQLDADISKQAGKAATQREREERYARSRQWIDARGDQARIEKAHGDGIKSEAKQSESGRKSRADNAQKDIQQLRADRARINKSRLDDLNAAARQVEVSRQRQAPTPYAGRNLRDETSSIERIKSDGKERERAAQRQAQLDADISKQAGKAATQHEREERYARSRQWIDARTETNKQDSERRSADARRVRDINKASKEEADAEDKRLDGIRKQKVGERQARQDFLREQQREVDRRGEVAAQRQRPSAYAGRNLRDETSSLERIGSDGKERERAGQRVIAARAERAKADEQSITQRGRDLASAQKIADRAYDAQYVEGTRRNADLVKEREKSQRSAQAKLDRIYDQQYVDAHKRNNAGDAQRAAEENKRTKELLGAEKARQSEIAKLRSQAEKRVQRSVETGTRRPAGPPPPPRSNENKGVSDNIRFQTAGLQSSNAFARGLASLSTELNHVGGTATGASHAIARGAGSMRLMAAATAETAARLSLYGAGAAALYGIVNVLGQVKDAALEADESLINMSRVVSSSSFSRSEGSQEMIRLMREMALGANDVGTAFFEMGKLMDTQQDAIKGAETVLLGTKIAELDVAEASQQLVKVQKAYGLGAGDLEGILDKLNDQQNRLGVGVGKGLTGIARAAGVTIGVGGELNALVARTSVLTQRSGFAPETVSRINQRLAIQLQTIKGQQRIAASLEGTGISLVNKDGSIRDIDSLLSEIGAKFKGFTSRQQGEVPLALLGGSQGGLAAGVTTLLRSYEEVEIQTKNVAKSAGSAREELAITMTTARNQFKLLGSELQAIGVNLADTGILTYIGILVTGMRESLEIVNDLLGAFNKMPEALKNVAVGAGALYGLARVRRGLGGTDGAGGGGPAAGAYAAAVGGKLASNESVRAQQRYELAAKQAAKQTGVLALGTARVAAVQSQAAIAANNQSIATANASQGFARLAAAQNSATTSTIRLAAATNAQSAGNLRGALSTAGGRLKGGGGIFGAGLLASILGGAIEDYGKRNNQSTTQRVGSVASFAGTGALLGSVVPGVGNGIGAGVGASIGAVLALYKDQAGAQREAERALTDLTATARRLQRAQEGVAQASEGTAKRQSIRVSAGSADEFDAAVKGSKQSIADSVRTEDVLGRQVTANRLEESLRARTDLEGEARSSLEGFITAIREGRDETLSLSDVMSVAGSRVKFGGRDGLFSAAGVDSKRIERTKTFKKSVSGLGGDSRLEAGEVDNVLREAGYTDAEASTIMVELRRALVEGLLDTEAKGVADASKRSTADSFRVTARTREILGGSRGVDEQIKGITEIDGLLAEFTEQSLAALDQGASKGDKSKAAGKRDKIGAQLTNIGPDVSRIFGGSNDAFLDSLAETARTGQSDGVNRLNTLFSSKLSELESVQQNRNNASILDAGSGEEVLALAEEAGLQFEDFAGEIEMWSQQVQLGSLDFSTALENSLTRLAAATEYAKANPHDKERLNAFNTTLSQFNSIVDAEMTDIENDVKAGRETPASGADRGLKIVAAIQARVDKNPASVNEDNLLRATKIASDVVTGIADGIAQEARGAIKATRDPAARQRKQRSLNRAIRLLRSAATGGGETTAAIVGALRAAGIAEDVIAAVTLASANAQVRAKRISIQKHRKLARAEIVAAQLQLSIAKAAVQAGRGTIGQIIFAQKQVDAAQGALQGLNNVLAKLNKNAKIDPKVAAALAAGFSSGADDALGKLGQENLAPEGSGESAADKAKQAAEEAREKAIDLVSARFEFLKALAGDDPVKVARLELQEQQQLAKFAKGQADRLRAKAAIINARRALREAVLEQAGGGQTFGIPNDVRLPTAFELKQVAGRYARSGAGAVGAVNGLSGGAGSTNVTANNRNSITIVVTNEGDRKRVVKAVSVATGADEQAMRSNGFSGGGLI